MKTRHHSNALLKTRAARSLVLALACVATPLRAQETRSAVDADDSSQVVELDDLVVTAATRTEKLAGALPVTTSVVSLEALDRQLAISSDLNQVLAQSVPGFTPSRQKLTSFGESFRGRTPLYLVDGVPQSNPLRAGSRESLTIDPFFLGRIEAVHGSSAAQGMGATGGPINYVTRPAPTEDGVNSLLEITGVSSTRFKSDGYGGKAAALTSVRRGAASLVAGATWEHPPHAFEGEGRPLGIDNTQGDTMDSDAYGLFLKAGYDLSARHNVELMVNHFNLAQNLRWSAVAGNRATGLPTSSVRGTTPGVPAENEVTSATLTFTEPRPHRSRVGAIHDLRRLVALSPARETLRRAHALRRFPLRDRAAQGGRLPHARILRRRARRRR